LTMRAAAQRLSGCARGLSGHRSYSGLAANSRVCVTGATGFIALHLVDQLLAQGYKVTAAVRTNDEKKLAPLLALNGGKGLDVVSGCDLLAPGSFDAAVAEAEVCFHTASPFWMDSRISDPWAQLVTPAEAGTRNVLDSCGKDGSSVKRRPHLLFCSAHERRRPHAVGE